MNRYLWKNYKISCINESSYKEFSLSNEKNSYYENLFKNLFKEFKIYEYNNDPPYITRIFKDQFDLSMNNSELLKFEVNSRQLLFETLFK